MDIFPKNTYRWSTVHEKMFYITNHQRNASKNHNELSPHICQKDFYQKEKKKKNNNHREDIEKMQPSYTDSGNVN